jgi:ABC-type transport system involved in multi-copper enzyme maturation permease subunit
MLAEIRSELDRLRRPKLLAVWLGLMAMVEVLYQMVLLSIVSSGTTLPPGAPGVSFPNAAELAQPDGLVAGLSNASTMLGVITLSFWATLTATDYSSGLVRLLVSAQPRRWRLLVGKVAALALVTAVATVVATMVGVPMAAPAASAAGVSTAAWEAHPVETIAGAMINTYAALLVWGVIGLALATLSRSAAVAISVGLGYVLLIESVVKMGIGGSTDWLLGSTLTALARGGTESLGYASAAGLALAYVAIGLGIAVVVFTRRDVTD